MFPPSLTKMGLIDLDTRLSKGKARLKKCLPVVLAGEDEPVVEKYLLQSIVQHMQTCEEYFYLYPVLALLFLVHLENAVADYLISYLFHHRHYHCMVMAALRYRRIQETPFLKRADVIAGLKEEFWEQALKCLVTTKRWSCLKTLMLHTSRPPPVSMCQKLANSSSMNEKGLDLFQTLLDHTQSAHWLRSMFAAAASSGHAQQFRLFVDSKNSFIRQIIHSYCVGNNLLLQMVDRACQIRRGERPYLWYNTVSDWNDCLLVGCQAGVFHLGSSPDWKKSAVETAVSHHQPDIVRFLCGAGMVTNGILYSLVQGTPDADKGESGDNQQQKVDQRRTQKLVLQKASTPGCLQNLCVQEVCRHVGWGHVKKEKVEKLPLPSVFKDMLMFAGLRDLLETKAKLRN